MVPRVEIIRADLAGIRPRSPRFVLVALVSCKQHASRSVRGTASRARKQTMESTRHIQNICHVQRSISPLARVPLVNGVPASCQRKSEIERGGGVQRSGAAAVRCTPHATHYARCTTQRTGAMPDVCGRTCRYCGPRDARHGGAIESQREWRSPLKCTIPSMKMIHPWFTHKAVSSRNTSIRSVSCSREELRQFQSKQEQLLERCQIIRTQ